MQVTGIAVDINGTTVMPSQFGLNCFGDVSHNDGKAEDVACPSFRSFSTSELVICFCYLIVLEFVS